MKLRPYQKDAKWRVHELWSQGVNNVCLVLPTGAGKSAITANIVHENAGPSAVLAHRQELVSQLSMALARECVRHKIIGPKGLIKLCVRLHMEELGRSYYDPSANCAVVSVQTLVRRIDQLSTWFEKVTLWVTDECHHLCSDNLWGKGVALFPNARGLGVTATPLRADGKGLGRHADGVMDSMVVGPSMRDLIDAGFLSDYRIFAPPSDLDLSNVKVSNSTGDFSIPALTNATRKSCIMGDVVSHYKRLAMGKRGLTFATDVKSAVEIAENFNIAGVPAIALDAKTPDADRVAALRKFKNGEYLQVVSVDLFDEGTDIPAVEVVSFARATQSYGKYVQSFGRALRLFAGKTHAIIIDHVGNVIRHGLPDAPRQWTLDAREKRGKNTPDDGVKLKACPDCTAVYERELTACPMCGFEPIPAGRSAPEQVDGDLHELDPATLAQMRGMVAHANMSEADFAQDMQRRHVPHVGQLAGAKRHRERLATVGVLRGIMDLWAGVQRSKGVVDERVSHKRFYLRFGVDVLTAQTLKTAEMNDLIERVNGDLI